MSTPQTVTQAPEDFGPRVPPLRNTLFSAFQTTALQCTLP